jgi:leucyl aminopeptidase
MAVVTDNTSTLLTGFIRVLAQRYSKLPLVDTACGYACSDHASWTSGGYASAALFESRFEDMNPNIHTGRDTVEKLDFGHMSEFAKVAVAFALHMTDPLN